MLGKSISETISEHRSAAPPPRRPPTKTKPSWGFFFTWLSVYTVLDILLEAFLHGHLAWNQLPGAIEGAILGAILTWLFALFRWYKAQDRF